MKALNYLFEQEELQDGQYRVPLIDKLKTHKLNPRTNRMKNFKTKKYLITDIPPEKRTFKNLPRYANKKAKVKFQDWLLIIGEKISPENTVNSWGWSEADRKCYGWSHRAVYGFGVGDTVSADACGNESGKEYVIKTKEQAKKAAIDFAKDVG